MGKLRLDKVKEMKGTGERIIIDIYMWDEKTYIECTRKMGVKDLCKAYVDCNKPFVDMRKYGHCISEADYAAIQQSKDLDFSITFDSVNNELIIFDGKNFQTLSLKDTLGVQL